MKDTMKLSELHGIEQHLYYGNAIEKIYVLIDDIRLTKWFETMKDRSEDASKLWMRLINFLEKEISILQLKLLHCPQSDNKSGNRDNRPGNRDNKPGSCDSRPGSRGSNSNYSQSNQQDQSKTSPSTCFICG